MDARASQGVKWVVILAALLSACVAEVDGMDQSRRWGQRFALPAESTTAETAGLDLSQLVGPEAAGPWEARDWTIFVLPRQDDGPLYNEPQDRLDPHLLLEWRIGSGNASAFHRVPVPVYGVVSHVAASNVSAVLRAQGGPLNPASPTDLLEGQVWVAPGRPACRWDATDSHIFVALEEHLFFAPTFTTGRFRLVLQGSADWDVDAVLTYPDSPIFLPGMTLASGVNGPAIAQDGRVVESQLTPGTPAINVTNNDGVASGFATIQWEVCA